MADFIKFGQSMLGMAKTCAANQDKSDTAAFFMLLHNTAQGKAAEDRRSGASKQSAAAKPAGGAGGTAAPTGDAPGAAMARLQAMLKGK